MRWSKTITVVGAHCEGEIGRVVTAGVIDVPGADLREKLRYLQTEHDELRRFAMHEPRGCAQMTTNLLLPPCDPAADAAQTDDAQGAAAQLNARKVHAPVETPLPHGLVGGLRRTHGGGDP